MKNQISPCSCIRNPLFYGYNKDGENSCLYKAIPVNRTA